MIKKVLLLATLFIIFLSYESIASGDDIIAVNRVAPFAVSQSEEKVSRSDCVTAVVKVIGADSEDAEKEHRTFYDRKLFLDVSRFIEKEDTYDKNAAYIFIAENAGIINGVSDDGREKVFCPQRAVTLKECLAFMVRCLQSREETSWDNTMEDSVKLGLLTAEELKYCDENSAVTDKQFYELISRMLVMNRYMYLDKAPDKPSAKKVTYIDTENGVRYIDCLKTDGEYVKEKLLRLVNNEKTADELIGINCSYGALKRLGTNIYSLLEADMAECVRRVDDKFYIILKTDLGKYVFLLYSFADEPEYAIDSWYCCEDIYLKDFEQAENATMDEVFEIDPYGDYSGLSVAFASKWYTTHHTSDGYKLKLEYYIDDKGEMRVDNIITMSGEENPVYNDLLETDRELIKKQ